MFASKGCRSRVPLLLATMVSLLVVPYGCPAEPDWTEVPCTGDEHCPDGYHCDLGSELCAEEATSESGYAMLGESLSCAGNDLEVFDSTTLEACQEACSLDEICTGVSFNPDLGRCVTKQAPCLCPSMGSETFYERVAAGKTIASANELSPITSYISLGDGMDCPFNDIRTCDGRTGEQCQGLCDLDSECSGVSHRASDGRCVTKSESCTLPIPGDHTFYVKP